MLQQDQYNLVAKIANKTRDNCQTVRPQMLGAFLNSMNPSFKSKKGGRVTALAAKLSYQAASKNQTLQRLEHSSRSRPCTREGIEIFFLCYLL
jgi:hypothetical protein